MNPNRPNNEPSSKEYLRNTLASIANTGGHIRKMIFNKYTLLLGVVLFAGKEYVHWTNDLIKQQASVEKERLSSLDETVLNGWRRAFLQYAKAVEAWYIERLDERAEANNDIMRELSQSDERLQQKAKAAIRTTKGISSPEEMSYQISMDEMAKILAKYDLKLRQYPRSEQ